MQEGPWRRTSGTHRRGRVGATQRETEPDTSGERRQTARETGTGRTAAEAGQGDGGPRRRPETGQSQGQQRHRETEERGEGAWERQRDGENHREKWREIREGKERWRDRGWGQGWWCQRHTDAEGRPGKEMNRKQSQRQGETERNGGERQWLRDGERNGQK